MKSLALAQSANPKESKIFHWTTRSIVALTFFNSGGWRPVVEIREHLAFRCLKRLETAWPLTGKLVALDFAKTNGTSFFFSWHSFATNFFLDLLLFRPPDVP